MALRFLFPLNLDSDPPSTDEGSAPYHLSLLTKEHQGDSLESIRAPAIVVMCTHRFIVGPLSYGP
jgi:hypothetical protein